MSSASKAYIEDVVTRTGRSRSFCAPAPFRNAIPQPAWQITKRLPRFEDAAKLAVAARPIWIANEAATMVQAAKLDVGFECLGCEARNRD